MSAPARTARRLCSVVAFVAPGWATTGTAQAAATNTAAFTSPGQYSFIVPPGVRSLTVIAIGAAGGGCPNPNYGGGGVGGAGAALTATVPVTPGMTLFVGVGAPGARCGQPPTGGAGGSGGGGAGGSGGPGGFGGGGGGGASLVGVAAPSPALGPQLLMVAGAGGGGNEEFADGGPAGAPGKNDVGGGGAGTSASGGGGGMGGVRAPGVNGAAGSFALGGTGGDCSRGSTPDGGGGGGGGGYYGGGGGGCATGGGGGGSSFVAPGVATLLGATPTASPSAVSITYPAPTADVSTAEINFAGQTPGTASPEKVLTVTNKGSAPLVVTGVRLGGSNPDDFLVSPRCQLPVPVGSSCQVGVRFDPQSSGERSATLTLVANTTRAPTTVALSGSVAGVTVGGPLHNVELLSCTPRARKADGTGAKTDVCTGQLVHGELDFTTAPNWTRAAIERGRVVYATGASMSTAHGGSELFLDARRALKTGTYVLILRNRRARRWVTRRFPLLLRRA